MSEHDALVASFEAFAANGASQDPAWVSERRRAAMGRFGEIGFPTPRNEEWRFTNVKRIADTRFGLSYDGGEAEVPDVEGLMLEGAWVALVVNGVFRPDLSRLEGLPEGMAVGGLRDSLDAPWVREQLGTLVPTDRDGFVALNEAFMRDGVVVKVDAGTVVERPIQILYAMSAGEQPVMAHPRSLVWVGSTAKVRMVETFVGWGGAPYLTNAVTELFVGSGANAECYRVQAEHEGAFHIASTYSRQGKDSTYSNIVLPFGGALCRHDIRMTLDGEGGSGTVNGLYVMHGEQHIDHHTVIDHAKPHCESHEFFNGILGDHARSVFNGRIVVREGAQKTDSKQTNNNLLLSPDARADSQPQLEIYADDVRCTHGATLGPIDEDAVFYMQSRGIGNEAARDMLTYGFGHEILQMIGIEGVREQADVWLKRRLLEARGGSAEG